MRRLGLFGAAAAVATCVLFGAGCAGDFVVDVTVSPSASLGADIVPEIHSLVFDVDGANTAHAVYSMLDNPFVDGAARVIFTPARGSVGAATVHVSARDNNDIELAVGSTPVTLKSKGIAKISIELSASTGMPDMLGGGGSDLPLTNDQAVMLTDGGDSDGSSNDLAGVSTLVFDRPLYHFGTLIVGNTTPAASFVVTNTGAVTSGSLSDNLNGSAAFVEDSDGCANKQLAPGMSCTIAVKFHPLASGAANTTLTVLGMPGGSTQLSLAGNASDPGDLTITPTMQAFADVAVGNASSDTQFTVTNGGTVDSGPLLVAMTGSDAAQFVISSGSDLCTGTTLAATTTCTFKAHLEPHSAGKKNAALVVNGSPGGTAVSSLSGNAVPPAVLTLTPMTDSFDAIALGDVSQKRSFVVGNTGMGPSGAINAMLLGDNANEFTITDNDCPATLATGAMCTLKLQMSPQIAGTKSAKLEVTSNPGGTVDTTLSGSGSTPAQLALMGVAPTAFMDTLVNTTGPMTMLTYINNGGATTGTLSTNLENANVTIVSDGCNGMMLNTADTCTIALSFTPKSTGALSTKVSVSGTPGGTVDVTLTGRGLANAVISMSPASNPFGDAVINTDSADVTFTVTNNGDQATGALAVTITGTNAAEFIDASSGAPTKCANAILAHLATCVVKIHFHPTSTATGKTATLTVTGTPGSTQTSALTGNGVAAGALTMTPTGNDFSSVLVGSSSSDVTFTVKNTGGSTTSALSTTLTGQFAIAPGNDACKTNTLVSGASCTIKVHFSPTATGSQTGSLTATAGSATASASLAGTGASAPTLQVSPSQFAFGSVNVGSSSSVSTMTVTNTNTAAGTITVTPTGSTADFTVVSHCTSLAGNGASCTIDLSFTPQSQGTKNLTITITGANGGSTNTLQIFGTGFAPVALTVAPGGTGASYGKIVSTSPDASINCPGTCGKSYNSGTMVTLSPSVTVAAAATFTGWTISGGGSCTGTGPCTVTVDVAKTVTGNFTLKQYTLSVSALSSTPGAVVSSTSGAISCGTTCSALLDYGSSVTLLQSPPLIGGAVFTGWSGACTGTGQCTPLMTMDQSVVANYAVPNKVFITSAGYLSSGLTAAQADADCMGTAASQSLAGTYVAWYSDSTSNAKDRLVIPHTSTPARGWVRVDRNPFADKVSDLLAGNFYYPAWEDEKGTISRASNLLTNTLPDGTYSGGCPLNSAVGRAQHEDSGWTVVAGNNGCSGSFQLYCFGVDNAVPVGAPPPPSPSRKIFVSATGFTPGGGVAAADAICQSEGTSAFGTGKTYLAFIASGVSPGARFSGSTPWARADGVVVFNGVSDFSANAAQAPPNRTATGSVLNAVYWTGASTPLSQNGSCTMWTGTDSSSFATGVQDWDAKQAFPNPTTFPCNTTQQLLCLEQ